MSTTREDSNPAQEPMVLFVGNDLMFQSKISSACAGAGLKLRVQRGFQPASLDSLGGVQPSLVVVDLGLQNLDLAALVSSIRASLPESRLLGYGSHVLTQRLDEASQLGFDAVLTRGQFDRDMSRIFLASAR